MGVSTEQKPTYDFGVSSNSYFNGNDGLVTRNDGKSIRIRFDHHGSLVAFNVKDYSFGVANVLDDDTKKKLADLNKHSGEHYYEWGDECSYEDALYEKIKRQWWDDAEWSTTEDPERPDWTKGVYSSGRSSGWCVIDGSERLAENFRSDEWTDEEEARLAHLAALYEDEDTSADVWNTLRDEHDALIEKRDAIIMRDEFLTMAFDMHENIDTLRKEMAISYINEDHAELEERREDNIERGND